MIFGFLFLVSIASIFRWGIEMINFLFFAPHLKMEAIETLNWKSENHFDFSISNWVITQLLNRHLIRIHEPTINFRPPQYFSVSDHHQMLSGSCERNIQFSIHAFF